MNTQSGNREEPRVLVVCHGNINRSPLCAAVLSWHGVKNVRQGALKDDGGGQRAAKKTREAARLHGYILEEHRSRKVELSDLWEATHVVYMDGGNLKRLQALAQSDVNWRRPEPYPHQEWISLGSHANPPTHRIKDPAFLNALSRDFYKVIDQVINASERLATHLSRPGDQT